MGIKGKKRKEIAEKTGKRKRDLEEEGGGDDLFFEAGVDSGSEAELDDENEQKESAEEKRLKLGMSLLVYLCCFTRIQNFASWAAGNGST